MSFVEVGGLRAFQFDLFEGPHLVHGIYTRQGGVSPEPWSSLNLGGTVGDERAHVVENRRRIFSSINRPVESIFDVWQVHSTSVICTRSPRSLDAPHQPADAILTDRPEITLFMRFADCVPVLLFDPVQHVCGIVHAGWKGTVDKIVLAAIRAMAEEYGCAPQNILAGIGPSICPEHYEIGPEVVEKARAAFSGDAPLVLTSYNNRTVFDLWTANRLLLLESGVGEDHIQVAGMCTQSNMQDWFSHRGEKGKTGRFGALIALT